MQPGDPKDLFARALDLPLGERTHFLDEACRDQPRVRARVDALLRAHDEADSFLDAPLLGSRVMAPGPTEQAGTTVGPYVLREHLGEGGFGTVWRAEQTRPVSRQVALKFVKHGLDSRAVCARFEQERQALALMDHPHVAKVLDGGETGDGRPYFVMELVQGAPITEFCDRNQLGTAERLQLFAQVCEAVQHAHQKGIIHRDLKPSNVLVSRGDDGPVPRIIDFGIAKAIHRPLTEKTLVTDARTVVGTLEYMAPEQAMFGSLDIDTRADVYSLGVILYELLTGSPAIGSHAARDKELVEVLRMIREDEPPKPSTRISTGGAVAIEVAERRRTDTRQLLRQLRGELDWVVMKALEKDRSRRYSTAHELAADVHRYLRQEVVLARPPSFAYRTQKLLRRYRGQVVAAGALLVVMLGGAAGTTWFALDAQKHSAVVASLLDQRAVLTETELHPSVPERIPDFEAWIGSYGALLAQRSTIEGMVRDLRARALPATPAELERDLKQHPQFAAWQALVKDLASERRAQAVREGMPFVAPTLPESEANLPAMTLGQAAWDRVANNDERKVFGEDDVALAMIHAALRQPETLLAPRRDLLDTEAWAWFRNGCDEEALAASQRAVDASPPNLREQYVGFQRAVQHACASVAGTKGREHLARREAELAALTAEVHARQTFRFAEPEAARMLAALTELLASIDRLTADIEPSVQRRLRWARQVDQLTAAHPNARVSWAEAAEAITAADGEVASVLYKVHPIRLRPQRGLVPIGMNPVSGLWEFYDLRSAWDGTSDPGAIEIPTHDRDGRLEVGEATGIVLVLLPGGPVHIGSQAADPSAANHDPDALMNMGPVRHVGVEPFFLSRYELTQGQWLRLWSGDPSLRVPSIIRAGLNLTGLSNPLTGNITLAHPVELVDWSMCDRLLRQHLLELPTEAQWEYGCRAGSTGPWSCPREELRQCANLADATARLDSAEWTEFEPWYDGHVVHARVGSFRANAFGLHDMHGNVFEWCSDAFNFFAGDNGTRVPGTACRGICGGSFTVSANKAKSAFRRNPPLVLRAADIGVRPARALRT